MSGRYIKQPLIYATARIKMAPIPSLTGDQTAQLEQAMLKCGFVQKKETEVNQVALEVAGNGIPASKVEKHLKRGFFSLDSKEAFIIDKDCLELRTSNYSRYGAFCEKFDLAITMLTEAVDPLKLLPVQELVLSYADFIAPLPGRILAEYFSKSNGMLPLSLVNSEESDLQRVGLLQVTRVVEADKRIFVSLEELPTVEGAPIRWLPKNMEEPDLQFGMPLTIRDEWRNLESTHYAILTTQASCLIKASLGELNFQHASQPIHNLTRQTFENLINSEVCNEDWEYTE